MNWSEQDIQRRIAELATTLSRKDLERLITSSHNRLKTLRKLNAPQTILDNEQGLLTVRLKALDIQMQNLKRHTN
jgi:hypothetical protein